MGRGVVLAATPVLKKKNAKSNRKSAQGGLENRLFWTLSGHQCFVSCQGSTLAREKKGGGLPQFPDGLHKKGVEPLKIACKADLDKEVRLYLRKITPIFLPSAEKGEDSYTPHLIPFTSNSNLIFGLCIIKTYQNLNILEKI